MKRRRLIFSVVGITVLAAVGLFCRPLTSAISTITVLHEAAPSELDLAEHADRSPEGLVPLWDTEKVVHRLFVAGRFRDGAPPALLRAAARTRDPDLQQAALIAMLKSDRPGSVREALSMLADPDPEVTLLALRTLASAGDKATMPHVLPVIKHRDPRVAVAAQNAMLRLANDPTFELNVLTPDERNAAVAAWEALLVANGHSLDPPEIPASTIDTLTPSELDLATLDGGILRLSDHKGKRVLINFWATWCGPCLNEMPTLVGLQNRYGDELVVLSVCVDAATGPLASGRPLDERVRELATKWKLNFPVALDTTGDVTAAYGAAGVPLTVLIDTGGRIQRRFTGPRAASELGAMIDAMP